MLKLGMYLISVAVSVTPTTPSIYTSLRQELSWKPTEDNKLEKLYKNFLTTWEKYFTEEEQQRRLEEAACQRMRNAMMMNLKK